MNGGVLGLLLGLIGGGGALGFSIWLARRSGEPEPVRAVLGLRPQSVERAAYGQAAKVSFPVFVVLVTLYLLAKGDPTTAGIVDGFAGATYGLSCAWAATRLR